MYPVAETPVVAIFIRWQVAPEDLYRIGEVLAPLRAEAVLIMGSGGVVHNLRLVHFEDVNHTVDSWAADFDEWIRDAVERKKLTVLIDFAKSHLTRSWRCRPLSTSARICGAQLRVTTASPLFTKASSTGTCLC